MHIGPTIKRPAMKYVVATINRLDVDVVAITGDLVDGNVYELSRHVAPLAGLRSRHGTFFVTGNHEYYSGVQPWLKYLPTLGVRVLLNEHVILLHHHAPIVLAGVTDFSAASYDTSHRSDVALAVTGAPRAAVKVLLAHQPRSAPAAEAAGFDLQISGHTHGGQFLPWNFFVRFQQPFTAGPAPRQRHAGLRQPRHRLLGAAQALRRAVRDHAAAARGGDPAEPGVALSPSASVGCAPSRGVVLRALR